MKAITDWRSLDLQSLDLVLCAGKSKMSNRIRWFQGMCGYSKEEADITHVGGIRNEFYNSYMQESTTLNAFADKRGVQENDFSEWLMNYNGKVYIKQLVFDRTVKFSATDYGFWLGHQLDDYENGIMGYGELLLCGLRLHKAIQKIWPSYQPLQTKNPHCTELVAKRLIEHNMLKQHNYANRMPPAMWWSIINDCLHNCEVKKPVRIK